MTFHKIKLSLIWPRTLRRYLSQRGSFLMEIGLRLTGNPISDMSTTSRAMAISSGSLPHETRSISSFATTASLRSRSTSIIDTPKPSSWELEMSVSSSKEISFLVRILTVGPNSVSQPTSSLWSQSARINGLSKISICATIRAAYCLYYLSIGRSTRMLCSVLPWRTCIQVLRWTFASDGLAIRRASVPSPSVDMIQPGTASMIPTAIKT